MRELIIDGDITAYKIASQCEEAIDWGDDVWTLHGDAKKAAVMFDNEITFLHKSLKATFIRIVFSDKKNFRKKLYKDYKANRKNKRKPILLNSIKDHARKNYVTETWSHLEADDVLGILATQKYQYERVIVSIDKDLRQIPGKLSVDGETIIKISKKEADTWHLFQSLMGDTVDGYSGCPGVGIKKAEKILGDEPTWDKVVKAYESAGLTEKDAFIQASMAKILRSENYVNNKIKLWRIK